MSLYSIKCTKKADRMAVSLEKVKLFLQIRNNDENELLKMLIEVATSKLETYLSKAFLPQEWTVIYRNVRDNYITLPIVPVLNIKDIQLIGNHGVSKSFESSEYFLETDILTFYKDYSANVLIIKYIAGIVPEKYEEVPAVIQYAICEFVVHLYEFRGYSNDEVLKKYDYLRVIKV